MTPNNTYAYYFTNLYDVKPQYAWWPMPNWAKKSADHTDEIAFVWGTVLARSEYSKLMEGILNRLMYSSSSYSLMVGRDICLHTHLTLLRKFSANYLLFIIMTS